jgi:hypothetical protein
MHLEKSTSSEFRELWQTLTHNQQRFAIAMLSSKTKKDAAQAVGLEPNTVYGWNGEVDAAVDFMRNHSAVATLGIIEANATKAAMIKAAGLDSDNEKLRQDVASEILDRILGKATQHQEVTGPNGTPLFRPVAKEDYDAV